MAKSSVDKKLLSAIVMATASQQFYYVTQAEGLPLINHNPPLIEVDTTNFQNGKAAARATDAGIKMVNGNGATQAGADQPSPYAIIDNAVLPPSKRGAGLRGGAPKQYPFDSLNVGQSFFVPVSEKHPDPVKTLGSAVSAANMRYAEETGETKQVERTRRGADHKALKDGNGNKITETVTVPVYKFTRKFSIRKAEKGVAYGSFTAPDNGALVQRTQ